MSFFLKWLKPETSSRVGLRPHRSVDLPLDYDAAYHRVLEAIELTLGAYISTDDRKERLIEAGFGLINNEKIRVTFEPGDGTTNVRIEAYYPAGVKIPETSTAVDALARALSGDPLEPGVTA